MRSTLRSVCIMMLGLGVFFSAHVYAQRWGAAPGVYKGTPIFANDGAATFTIGSKGYLFAGSASRYVYEFDSLTAQWKMTCEVPKDMGRAFAMAFVINSTAYIVGGDTGGYATPTVWAFDPLNKTNFWTRKKDFPTGPRDAGVGFAIGGKGYVACGFDGTNVYSDIWEYDLANDAWTQEQVNVPGGGIIFPSAFVIGNKAYITGGGVPPTATSETQQLIEYDPAMQQCTPKASFGGQARQAAFAFSNATYGYVGGGMTGYQSVFHDMWRYDPANDKWTQVENFPLFGPAWSSAFVIGNTAYVGLGVAFVNGSLSGNDSFSKYRMEGMPAVTAIRTFLQLKGISLYPNPAGNLLHIEGDAGFNVSISILDMQGRNLAMFTGQSVMDISTLPRGLYIVQLRTDNGNWIGRFEKN